MSLLKKKSAKKEKKVEKKVEKKIENVEIEAEEAAELVEKLSGSAALAQKIWKIMRK